jgi:hypothetical protein
MVPQVSGVARGSNNEILKVSAVRAVAKPWRTSDQKMLPVVVVMKGQFQTQGKPPPEEALTAKPIVN